MLMQLSLLFKQLVVEWVFKGQCKSAKTTLVEVISLAFAPLQVGIVQLLLPCLFIEARV